MFSFYCGAVRCITKLKYTGEVLCGLNKKYRYSKVQGVLYRMGQCAVYNLLVRSCAVRCCAMLDKIEVPQCGAVLCGAVVQIYSCSSVRGSAVR